MQETDFAPADGFAPIDPPILLGFDPAMLIGLVLLLLAVAAAMFLLGRWRRGQTGGSEADRAAEDIHKAILRASSDAMSARSDALLSRAETLRLVIAELLGPVLTIGKEAGGPHGALAKALKGKGPAKPDHDKKPDANAPTPVPVHADTARQPVTINQIYVGGGPVAADPHGHGDDGHGHKPSHSDKEAGHGAHPAEDRDLTAREQIDEVSKAVRAFHDYWSRGPERIRELRAARQALSRRPPSRLLGDGDKPRVWDRH